MKKQPSTQISFQMLIIGCLVAIISFFLGYSFKTIPKNMITPDDRETLISAIGSLNSDIYAFGKSNLEWVAASIGLTPKGFMKSSIIRTTVYGKVVEKSQEKGKMPILSKYYYVGEPGFYEYGGAVSLTDKTGNIKEFHFSPKRMETMRVVSVVNGRENPISFNDIKEGNMIEIEETVDLAQTNINDENLISLTVRLMP